jgi:hypothetical protein
LVIELIYFCRAAASSNKRISGLPLMRSVNVPSWHFRDPTTMPPGRAVWPLTAQQRP